MILVHGTIYERATPILREGIKSSMEIGIQKRIYSESNPSLIYLIITCSVGERNIWATDCAFYLNMDFFRANKEYFKAYHNPTLSSDVVYNFIKEYDIEEIPSNDEDATNDQVISLKPIPVEGLDSLFLKSSGNCNLVRRLRDILPGHMHLYVWKDQYCKEWERIK